MKSIVYLATGAVVSAAIIVACSDDSPPRIDAADAADAAVCDCPVREAPITAARFVRVDMVETAATNTGTSPIATCPAGSLLMTGSCYIDQDNTARELSLLTFGVSPREAAMQPLAWSCSFLNRSTTQTGIVRAQALCLLPGV